MKTFVISFDDSIILINNLILMPVFKHLIHIYILNLLRGFGKWHKIVI